MRTSLIVTDAGALELVDISKLVEQDLVAHGLRLVVTRWGIFQAISRAVSASRASCRATLASGSRAIWRNAATKYAHSSNNGGSICRFMVIVHASAIGRRRLQYPYP